MRKITLLLFTALTTTHAFADNITDGIAISGDHVYSYTPYVQGIGYVLAAIIGLVGAFSVYTAYIRQSPDVGKRALSWGMGSLAMLCMTIALPQFFKYEESGFGGNGTTLAMNGSTSGSMTGGDKYGNIDTSIPNLSDERWIVDADYIPVIVGNKTTSVSNFLNDIYDRAGGGAEGSYGRALSYLRQLAQQGAISNSDYNTLLSYSGNLPHN